MCRRGLVHGLARQRQLTLRPVQVASQNPAGKRVVLSMPLNELPERYSDRWAPSTGSLFGGVPSACMQQ